MKNNVCKFCLIALTLILSFPSFAHKEWVHQHQVKQAYLLLKEQLGFDVPTLWNNLGFNHSGPGAGVFLGNSIVQSAWEEDLYDPIWEVGTYSYLGYSYCGWDASSTHFWHADAGDNSPININMDLNDCPLPNGEIPNAYQKALYYINGGWEVKWKPQDNFTFYAPSTGHNYRFERQVAEVPMVVTFFYNSLVDHYTNGNITFIWNPHSNFRIYDLTLGSYVWIEGLFSIPEWMRDIFVWEILGRTAHLLGDMSVPAHVHNDVHPCYVQIPFNPNGTLYNEGDSYELYTGGLVGGSNPQCNDPQSVFPAQNKTWSDALNQGGFINVFGKENPIRYLFYTTNQLADHFGSLTTDATPQFDPTRWYPGDGNYTTNFGNDYYLEFDLLINTMGSPITDMNDYSSSVNATTDAAFVYSIRAIAGLFYWFANEVEIIPQIPPIFNPTTPFIQNPNPICLGESGLLTVNLSQGNGELYYDWYSINEPAHINTVFMGSQCRVTYLFTDDPGGDGPSWDFGCTVYNDAGSDTETGYPILDSDCYGCPTLAFEIGGQIINENPLLISSLDNLGVDVTDYYLINTPITPDNGEINLNIHEPQTEHTWMDQVELLEVKVNKKEYVAVTGDGEIVNYVKPVQPYTVTLNDTLDVTDILSELDSNTFSFLAGDILQVEINNKQLESSGGEEDLVLGAESPGDPQKKMAGVLKFKNNQSNEIDDVNGKEKTLSFGNFYVRPNMSILCARLDAMQNGLLEIELNQGIVMDYLTIVKNLKTAKTKSLTLLSANHNQSGDVTELLNVIDQNYSEIYPGERIDFIFQKGNTPAQKTEYILKSVGRYETDSTSFRKTNKLTGIVEGATLPKENKLFDNYPNPFNPITQINYSIKEYGSVLLSVFDVLGNEAAVLVNDHQPAGNYTVKFDASNLASGIYFYQLQVKNYTKIKKMILLK